jgi:acyl-CoA thioesterase FadM
VRIEHAYVVYRPDGQVACEAATTLACIDTDGRLQPLPGWLAAAK